jgi:transposase-like protein
MSNAGAAQALGVAVKSVSKWRRQFADQRLAGLEDAAPVGRRKAELVLTDAERSQLVRWARRAKMLRDTCTSPEASACSLVATDVVIWTALIVAILACSAAYMQRCPVGRNDLHRPSWRTIAPRAFRTVMPPVAVNLVTTPPTF